MNKPEVSPLLRLHIAATVATALQEDVMTGDINAQLLPADTVSQATIISREDMVMAGMDWVDQVFLTLDPKCQIEWHVSDGDQVTANQCLAVVTGNTRGLLTGERVALNFLQTLSGTATVVHHHMQTIADLSVKLLDTRKTIPNMRLAQKYATLCGGGYNHRVGLYDAFLIKENHIMACGGIAQAINSARKIADKPIEVEVETETELWQAVDAGADIVMLDNFDLVTTARLVAAVNGHCQLEASGDITLDNLRDVALTGVDYISMGALTKHIRAIDLSMRLS